MDRQEEMTTEKRAAALFVIVQEPPPDPLTPVWRALGWLAVALSIWMAWAVWIEMGRLTR